MFKRDFHAQPRRGFERSGAAQPPGAFRRSGRCIALIDARYLTWLATQDAASDGVLRRRALLPVLGAALAQSGLELDLRRVYWYADRVDAGWFDDQVARGVLSEDADGGVSMVRAIAADLAVLAQRRAADVLLVASDDERLLSAIDDAQSYGVSVCLLCDERDSDPQRISQEDPGWASLLAQADRRVMLGERLLSDLVHERAGAPDAADVASEDPERSRAEIEALVEGWWDEEPEASREDLREELRLSRGIPAEVDRVLLLRMRRTLGRALNWPEKRLMRELARARVLGAPLPDATPEEEAPHTVVQKED